MDAKARWWKALLVVGLLAILVGAIDPLEGSVVILPGTALVAIAAYLGASRHLGLAAWGCGLTIVGVVALFVLSAFGGVGGETGRSMWLLLVVVPYPIGVVLAIVAAIRILTEKGKPGHSSFPEDGKR